MASFVRERTTALAWPRDAVLATLAAAFLVWELVTPRSAVRIEHTLPLPGGVVGARLAMAVLATAAVAVLAFVLARTASRRVATHAVVVLATMPAWFVHGRLSSTTMIPLAAAALVLAGLGLALVDERASPLLRGLGLVIAAGAAAMGVAAENAFAVVAPATIGAGAAALAHGASARRRSAGAVACAAGVLLAVTACVVVLRGVPGPFAAALVGPRLGVQASTFDAGVAPLAYGFLPWSPLAALAFGRRPSTSMHFAVVVAAGLALVAHGVSAMRGPAAVVVGVAPVGAAVAFALDAIDRVEGSDRRRPSVLVPLVLVALGALVAHDVDLEPERVMIALGAKGATLPPAYVTAAAKAVRSSTWLVTALATVALLAPRSWLPSSRGIALALAGALGGLVLRAHTVPTLLARLSPGAAIDAYARARRPGDRLGTLGIDPRESATLAPAERFASSRAAASWLAAATPTADRRFLAFAAPELPSLNAEFRRERHANVPVLAGGDGVVLLAASTLTPGEKSENSLDAFLLDRAPADVPHPLDAVIGERFDVLGWELTDDHGTRIAAAKQGKKSHLRLFLRVRDGGTNAHCTFIHVEHTPTRYSSEHATHPEPMSMWGAGDVVADDFEVTLPAAFRPGAYAAYWGVGVLPCHDDARMPITRGPSDGHDRLSLGALEVR